MIITSGSFQEVASSWRIWFMRAVVLVSGARCWSTALGVWKDSPARWGQEVVGGLGGVDHVEVGVDPVGEVGYGPELGG